MVSTMFDIYSKKLCCHTQFQDHYIKGHKCVCVCVCVCVFFLSFFLYPLWCCDPTRVMASSFLRFLDHTQQCITASRTPLDE